MVATVLAPAVEQEPPLNQLSLPLQTRFGAVRPACLADHARIAEMVRELAAHHGDVATLTAEDLARDAAGDEPWVSIIVAESGDQLVGYAAMFPVIQLQFGARGMDIHHLFTAADHRGIGVGRSLVEACKIEAISLSCRYLAVGTHPENNAAQAFFTSLGFVRRHASATRFSTRLEV
jgi:GNAT superfamily N-acetyltransferase